MIFDDTLQAWGEKRGGAFVPMFTDEEYQFRLDAVKKMDSGDLTQDQILELQRECVERAQKSKFSQSRIGIK